MDASTYGRLVKRGGYANGGIVAEPVAWLDPLDPPAFVYPALGVTRGHLIGPPYYAAMWDAKRARAVEAAEASARRERRTAALDAFTYGLNGPSALARLLAGPMVTTVRTA